MDVQVRIMMLIKAFMEKQVWKPQDLYEKLECGRHTFARIRDSASAEYNFEIKFDNHEKVWVFEPNKQVSLPYVWFTPSDVMVLLTLLETFKELPFGVIKNEAFPFKEKLETMLKAKDVKLDGLLKSIRILPIHYRRKIATEVMSLICDAIVEKKKIKIKYKDRQGNKVTERVVTPIQIVRYRDNWYLDAFCHFKNKLRIFSLDRIESSEKTDDDAKNLDQEEVRKFLSESYGIFSGKPKAKAVLRFTPQIAKWVEAEEWHPKQKSHYDKEGYYILEIPYSDERELVLDIMRYGDEVKVLRPTSLQELVKSKLKKALKQYK
jgi:predicted DNA-binding transcriptional regulator YafY